jgi:hypothetical protein
MGHPQPSPAIDPVPTAPPDDRYLGLQQLVAYSGLGLRTLNRHLRDPQRPLPHFRVGGRVLVRKSDFDRWIEQVGGRDAARGPTRNAAFDARVAAAVKSIRG